VSHRAAVITHFGYNAIQMHSQVDPESRKVFRAGGTPGLAIGTLFCGAPIVIGVQTAIDFPTKGIIINEVTHHEPTALFVRALLMLVFGTVGVSILLASWVSRVEISRDSIEVINWLNQRKFAARWAEVSQISRDVDQGTRARTSSWALVANGLRVQLPQITDHAELLFEIANRVRPGVIHGDEKPEPGLTPSPDSGSPAGAADSYTMFFSVLWYGFLAFFSAGAILTSPNTSLGHSFFSLLVVAAFGFIPYSTFRAAWQRRLTDKVSLNIDGLTATHHGRPMTLAWKDLLLAEVRKVPSKGEETERTLVLIGSQSHYEIRESPMFAPVLSFVRAYAPEGAALLLSPASKSDTRP
jgi:hypothetical protein